MLSKFATVKEVETQLRQSALVERDMARKRQETLSLYLKDKLQEDQKNTAENLQKLNESFKESMSLTQGSELLEGMRALKHRNEKRLDEMDFIIQKMVGELQEADHQIEEIQRSHLQHMEPLLDQHKMMLMKLEQERESNLHDLSSKFSSEKEKLLAILQQQNQALVDLPDELFPMGISETIEEFDDFRWVQILARSKSRPGSSDDKKQDRSVLDPKIPPGFSIAQSENFCTRLRILENEYPLLIQEKEGAELDRAQEIQKDRQSEDQINEKCIRLRHKLERNRQEIKKNLIEITVHEDTATKKLQAVVTKGEKVLRAFEWRNKLLRAQGVLPLPSVESKHLKDEAEQDIWESAELQQSLNCTVLQRKELEKPNTHSEAGEPAGAGHGGSEGKGPVGTPHSAPGPPGSILPHSGDRDTKS